MKSMLWWYHIVIYLYISIRIKATTAPTPASQSCSFQPGGGTPSFKHRMKSWARHALQYRGSHFAESTHSALCGPLVMQVMLRHPPVQNRRTPQKRRGESTSSDAVRMYAKSLKPNGRETKSRIHIAEKAWLLLRSYPPGKSLYAEADSIEMSSRGYRAVNAPIWPGPHYFCSASAFC